MSEHLHPDIDSLNAFVEGVLQEHERVECLTHLAECPRCREIVFLAQEPPSVAATPKPAVSWRRWFTPIPVLATAAVICIVLAGFWLYLRPRMEAPRREIAARVTQSPPQSPDNRVEAQIPKPSVARKGTPTARAQRKFEPSAEQKPPVIATPTSIQPPPEVSLPPVAPPPLPFSIPQLPPPPPNVEARSSEPASGMSGRVTDPTGISGTVTDSTGAVVPGASVELRQLAGTMTSNARSDANGAFKFTGLPAGRYELRIEMPGFRLAVQQIDVRAQEIAAVHPELQVGASAETVEVTAASSTIQTETAQVVGRARRKQAPPPPEPRSLPSALPATTTVTRREVMLAVDSSGALFFSGNGGKSWKAVKPLWPGKVVDLVSPAEPPQPSTVGFQLTTDSHSIWLSKDGRHWYSASPQP